MGKLLVTKIREINPLAKKGVLLLWAFLLSFACTFGSTEANAAPAISDAWTNIYAAASTGTSISVDSSPFTANAGANRMMFAVVHVELSAANTLPVVAVSYGPSGGGGAAFTQINTSGATSARVHTWMGFLPDALIASGAQLVNVQATVGSAANIIGVQVNIATYTGVDQNVPITASKAAYVGSSTAAFATALSYALDSITIFASANSIGSIAPTYSATGGSAFSIAAGATSGTGGFSGNVAVSGVNSSAGAYDATTTSVTYSGGGNRTSFVAASISPPIVSSDTTKPVVTSFIVPISSTSTTITVNTFTATDDVGVTGYKITESATPPSPVLITSSTPPTSYVAATGGAKTLYAWAKDAAGNVSNYASQTCVINVPIVPTRTANWSSQYAAAAYPAGAISNYTMAAGANRLLLVAIASTSTAIGVQSVTNVTWGGKALTLASGDETNSSVWNHSYIYYLKEADIALATGNTLAVSISGGTPYYTRVYAAVYTGVDQTTPITSAVTYTNGTANTTVGPFSPTLTVDAYHKSVEIVNLARSVAGTVARSITTWAAGWTTVGQTPTGIVTSGPTQRVYIRDRAVTSVLTADSSQHTASGNSYDSMTALTMKPAPEGVNLSTGSTVASKSVYAGDLSVAVDAFTISSTVVDTVTNIQITGSAASNSTNVSALRIYRKVGSNGGIYEDGDIPVANLAYPFAGGTVVNVPVSIAALGANNYIIVYDIAGTATPSQSNTLTANVTAFTATTLGNLSDPVGSSGIITIYPTTTIGNGSEPPTARLYKASAATNLDAFTLVHNGTVTDDDSLSTVTVTLTPEFISGSGAVLSKIAKLEVVNDVAEPGTTVYGSMTAATTGDIWNIPTIGLVATATPTNYYLRITTAANIVPGFYTVGGKITSVVHSKTSSKLVNNDITGTSQTLSIDVEPPIGPTTLTATTTAPAVQPGGKIELSWNAATDPNVGALHPTTPYIVKRSVAGGTAPAEYCSDGATVPVPLGQLTFQDSGLNSLSAPIYHYRICAMDALGNISVGKTAQAASSYTDDCDNAPELTLGLFDPLLEAQTPPVYVIQDQLIKSEGGQPFNLQVTNMDIGTCPNVTFNIALVQTSTTGGSCTICDATDPPPSLADFSTTYPASVYLGKTAGTTPPGSNKTSAMVPIYINGLATVDQIQKYTFKVQVSATGHPATTTLQAATGILNDMPPIVHNANNMGKYQYGTWGNTYTCATCHSNETSNIKGVYQIISTPIGKRNVVFTKTSSTSTDFSGVYSNDQRPNKNGSDQVCSVCHHRTRQHQYSASKAFGGPENNVTYDSNHHNSRDCVKCHTHNTAFRSIFGVCGDCHGFKGTQYAPVNRATMVKVLTNALGTSPPSYGAHLPHNVAKMTCAVCHSNTNHGLATDVWLGDEMLEIGFQIDNATYPGFNPAAPVTGGAFAGTTSLNSPYRWVEGPGTTITKVADYNSSCSTYCHGGWAGNVGSNTYPNWVGTGQAACGTCHNATTITPPVSGSHVLHSGTGATGLGIACIKCHGTYTLNQYTGSKHINGNVEWSLSAAYPGATYNGADAGATNALAPTNSLNYSTCTNLYCHSNVQGPGGVGSATYADPPPLWGDNGAASTTAACGTCHIYPNTVGGHAQHENEVVAFDCHVCHNNGGRTTPQQHADGTIDFQFIGMGQNTVYSKGNSVTPGTGYGSCNTGNCHGNYTRVWGPATALPLCNKCHGSRTSARGFYNTRGPDGTLSIYSAAIGVHDIHLQNLNSPRKATFQRFTSFATGFNCNQCHYNPNGPFSPGHIDTALPAEVPFAHMSSIAKKGVAFNYYSTPSYAAQTCSSVWCHGAGMASNTSKGLYAGTIPAIQRQNPQWNLPMLATGDPCTKCHAMPPQALNSTSTHWNIGANRLYIVTECVGCHQHLNNSGTSFVNKSLHVNGIVDGGCTGCHGNPPTTTGIGTDTGLAIPAQNALQTGTAGAHAVHIANVNILKNCYTCHYNYNPVMISDGTGQLEIGFNGFGGKVKTGIFTGYTNSVNGPKWVANSAPGGTTSITKVNGTPGQEANVCSNLYCHGSTIISGNLKNPNWELPDQAICGTCHGGIPSDVPFPAQAGAHARHASNSTSLGKAGLSLACETCHGPSAASTAHVNGSVTWELDPNNPKIGSGAMYKAAAAGTTGLVAPSASYGTCSTFYCHSNVQGVGGIGDPTSYKPMTWGASTALTCVSCHDNQVAAGTASHLKHTALYGGAISCGYCHHDAGANTELHADGMIYVNITTSRKGAGAYSGFNRVAGSAAGYGDCSNVICHGAATLKWGANLGTTLCQKCHGSKSAPFLTVSSAQVAPGFGTDGIATDGTTAATSRRVGSHQRHLTTNILSSNVKCSECHVKVVNVLDNGHLNYSTATVSFAGRATGNGHTTALTSRTVAGVVQCSNLWCHTGKSNSGSTPSPVWTATGMINETTLAVASCNVCHGFPPKSVGAGGTALTYDHTSLAIPSAFPVTTCTGCHTNMSQTGTNYTDIFGVKSQHLNGTIEAIMNCDACHDYDTNGGTWGNVKNANYGGLAQGNGAHYKHIQYLKAKYNATLSPSDTWASTGYIRVCGTCHSIDTADHSTGTPANPRSISFGDKVANPRNFGGAPFFNGLSGTSSSVNPKSCSNIDCHYRTSPIWSTY